MAQTLPDAQRAEAEAALAPTLKATESILPWVARPQPPRFSNDINQRWDSCCQEMSAAWAARHQSDLGKLRHLVFVLQGIAVETCDAELLNFCEALASAMDFLDMYPRTPKIEAALSACFELLLTPGGLENPAFSSRATHCAQRLTQTLTPSNKPGERSDVLDHLFVEDALEQLERMRDALSTLPVDIYSLKIECESLSLAAEQIEMWGIYHLARQLENFVLLMSEASQDMQDRACDDVTDQIEQIHSALLAVDV